MSMFDQRFLPASPWSQTSMSAWFTPYYSLFERLPIGYNSWIKPQNFIVNIFEDREPSFQSRKLYKRCGEYWMSERNGREVEIGAIPLSDKFIVNANPDRTFDCFFCMMQIDEKKFSVTIPYKDFMHHNILQYLPPEFRRNPDCPSSYIVMAFFEELMNGDDIKFLQLPKHTGWNRDEQHSFFASSDTIIPQLSAYYAPDMKAMRTSSCRSTTRLSASTSKSWQMQTAIR